MDDDDGERESINPGERTHQEETNQQAVELLPRKGRRLSRSFNKTLLHREQTLSRRSEV